MDSVNQAPQPIQFGHVDVGHVVLRTSFRGHPFRGTCSGCGRTDIGAKDIEQPCPGWPA